MRPAKILFKRRYPKHLLELIDWAMEVDPLLRPQDAGTMLDALLHESGRPQRTVKSANDSRLERTREQRG